MCHFDTVETLTATLSRWRADAPAGTHVKWNAEINNEVPNRVIGWRSIEGSDVVSGEKLRVHELLNRPEERVTALHQVGDEEEALIWRDGCFGPSVL